MRPETFFPHEKNRNRHRVSREHVSACASAWANDQVPRPEQGLPPSENPTPETQPNTGADHLPLSERLHRQEGVITPPAGIDPEIKRVPPDPVPGKMPVIPPPGEPGGDPSIQPK